MADEFQMYSIFTVITNLGPKFLDKLFERSFSIYNTFGYGFLLNMWRTASANVNLLMFFFALVKNLKVKEETTKVLIS